MLFDADQMIEALEPPAFKAGGRVYTGAVLSVPEVLRLQQRVSALDVSADTPYQEALDAALDVVRALFPTPWYTPWFRRPEYAFARLPFQVQLQLIQGFLQSLVAMVPTTRPGTASQASDSPSVTS